MNASLSVGITMGDAAGIGPEIVVKAIAQGLSAPCVVYGDAGALRRAVTQLGARLEVVEIRDVTQASPTAGRIHVISCSPALPADLLLGQISAAAGRGAYDYVCAAIDDAQAGRIRAIVTAPLNKKSMHEAGIDYPGHTEILADRSATQDFAMMLEALLRRHPDPRLSLSPALAPGSWEAAAELRMESRERDVEGFMLKRAAASYQSGRRRGDWWKWKIDPLTIDAVLLYTQSGHGRRSTLYTDYTFGLWQGDALVPIAKAYSGLDDKEILELDRWLRAHTRERFGPVRSVEPVQVFELGFEGVNLSKRHKSGVAVRFPRILRWRRDKPAAEADQLNTLKALAR